MKLKLYLILLILLFSHANAQKRCNLVEVNLAQSAQLASVIVEGTVLNAESVWDKERKNIYTIYAIDVSGIFKGNSNPPIRIVVPGGMVGLQKHVFSSSLELQKGNTGVFFLKNLTYPVAGNNLYELVADSQGFIQYHKDGKSAKGVFEIYDDIDADLKGVIEKKTRSSFQRIKPVNWDRVTSNFEWNPSASKLTTAVANNAVQATISGFYPTTVQAGRDVELTINGSGFGSTRGSGYVAFKNADSGGLTYAHTYSNQYVLWSDNQIIVKVPGQAGTGTILVKISGANLVSSEVLTVDYSILTFQYAANIEPYEYNVNNSKEYNTKLSGNNGTGGYTFKYTADVPENGKMYFEKAVKDWRCNTKAQFLISSVNSSLTSIGGDGENTVDYSYNNGSGTLAKTVIRLDACEINGNLYWYTTEIDIEVNSSYSLYYGTADSFSGYDFYTAILHELGHANQLGHVIDNSKVMNYSLGSGQYNRTIDTSASQGGTYWVNQSTDSANCGSNLHSTMNCSSVVSFSTTANSVSENAGTFTVTATQNQTNYADVVVDFSYSATATATSGIDYTPVTSLIIPAGSLSASATIALTEDTIYEGNETIIIDISAVTNATENGVQQQTVTLLDNETAPTVSLSKSANSIAENSTGSVNVTATLSCATTVATTIVLEGAGTSVYNTDYNLSATTLTIPAGSLSAAVTFKPIDDIVFEGSEPATINIASVSGGNGASENGNQSATVYIEDDDPMPTVTLGMNSSSVTEGGAVNLTATISEPSIVTTTVNLGFSGTAVFNTDFTISSPYIIIPAGSTSATLTLAAIDDTVYENPKTAVIDIVSVTNANQIQAQQQSVTIIDNNDRPTVTLSGGASSIGENGGSTTITATLSNLSEADTTVHLGFSGAATNTTDYTLNSSIAIPAGSLAASINLNTVNDAVYEGNENILISITTVENGTEDGLQQKNVTIIEDETQPTVSISTSTTTIAESGGSYTITASLSNVSAHQVTFYILPTGDAQITSDFNAPFEVVIPAGSTSVPITVNVLDDNLYENVETIKFDIGNYIINAAENGVQQVSTTLINDDLVLPNVSLAVTTLPIAENGNTGTATVTATLSTPIGSPTIVSLGFSGSAALGTDYTADTTITIPAGQLSASLFLNPVNDSLFETNETVTVAIASVTNAIAIQPLQGTITITDDDSANKPSVSLSVNTSSVSESTVAMPVFTATLSAVSGADTIVNLSTGGTAVYNTDYTLNPYSIVIPAGSLTGTSTLLINNDALYEISETCIVQIDTVTNGIENGTQSQTVTITNDDAIPTVTLSVSSVTVSETAGATVTITSTLSQVSGLTALASYTLTGTAGNGTDYSISGVSLINAGSLTSTRTITINADTALEGNETIIIDITGCTRCIENGVQQQTITILDDELPSVSLSTNTTSIAENNTSAAIVTATLSTVSTLTTTVNLEIGGTATPTADYALNTLTIVIPAGALSGTATISSISDTLPEENETINVAIMAVENGFESGIQQQTIALIDDDFPNVTLATTATAIAESSGSTLVSANLSGPYPQDVTVALSIAGTASLASDYILPASITIPAGSTSASIALASINDALDEPDETITIDISSVTNAIVSGSQQKTVTIIDDDAAPTVTLTTVVTVISETSGSAAITAKLSAVSGQAVTVNLGLTGTATLNADYTLANVITIPAGSISASLTLAAVYDLTDEANETVIVDITSVINGIESGTQQKTITINDDDAPPLVTLTTGTSTIAEASGTTTVTAKLSAVSSYVVTVNLGLSGTASLTSDYTLATSITIPAGSTSASITLVAVNDNLDEANETVIVDVTSVTNGLELGTQQKTVTISDDDATPTVALSTGTTTIAETSGTTIVTATLSAVSGQTLTVNLGLTGTAAITSDYTLATSITIPAGSLSVSINLSAVNDFMDEVNETIIVDVLSVTNALELGTQQKTITIVDDDAPPSVTLNSGQSTIAETSGITVVTATLSAVSSQTVTVTLGLTGTATLNADYTVATSIIIPAGSTSASNLLTTLNDAIDEPNETIIVDITSVINATELGTQQKIITITDDDLARSTAAASTTLPEENVDLESGIKIYPNPGNGVFNIQLPSAMQIEVYDIFGQLLLSKKMDYGEYSFDISDKPAGTYFVKAIVNEKVSNFKIIRN